MSLAASLLLLLIGPARAAEAEEEEAPAEQPDPGEEQAPAEQPPSAEEVHAAAPDLAPAATEAPAPVATPAVPAPPTSPPEGWVDQSAPPTERPAAPRYAGWYGSASLLGGSLGGGGATWISTSGIGLDLGVGLRLGLGADLLANPVLSAGLTWTAGERTRSGAFLRVGSTPPLPDWLESFVAAGLALRMHGGTGTWIGFDLGLGAMVVQDLPGGYEPWPGMLYARMVLDIPTTPGQRNR